MPGCYEEAQEEKRKQRGMWVQEVLKRRRVELVEWLENDLTPNHIRVTLALSLDDRGNNAMKIEKETSIQMALSL